MKQTKSAPNLKLFEGSLTGIETHYSIPDTTEKYNRSDSFPISTHASKDKELEKAKKNSNGLQYSTGMRKTEIDDLEGNKTFKSQKSRLETLLKNNREWDEENGFSKDCDPEELKKFYIMANQLLIFGEKISQCLLCGRHKYREPKSHVFPKALLKAYGEIHGSIGNHFIWDMSKKVSAKPMAPSKLSFPLLCEDCETTGSKEEDFLVNKYLEIMQSGMELTIEIAKEEYYKLKHILAVVLFRGAMLTINILEDLLIPGYLDNFLKKFLELRKLCLEEDCTKYEGFPVISELKLFLLPNAHFNPDNIEPTFLLDYQLRNPQYTSIVTSEGTPFMYMKFDCFHCALPFNGDVKDLTDVKDADTSGTSPITFAPNTAINSFPKPLLHYGILKAESLLYCITEYQFQKDVLAAIQPFKMLATRRRPKEYHSCQEPAAKNTIKQDILIWKNRAKDFSPFKDPKDELEKLLTAERERNKDISKSLCKKEEAFQELQAKVKTLEQECENLKHTLEMQKTEQEFVRTQVIPKSEQGIPKTEQETQVIPESEQGIPKSEQEVPKSKQGTPQGLKSEQVIPKSEQRIPKTEQGTQVIPKSEQGIPQGTLVIPKSEQGIPKSEQGMQAIPKSGQGILRSEQRIPKSEQVAQVIPKNEQVIPKSEQGIPKSKQGTQVILKSKQGMQKTLQLDQTQETKHGIQNTTNSSINPEIAEIVTPRN